ncbi:hypothetical protein KDH_75290 [Dictyobacter sp. S3.2.2.5]|uniref:Uncharacterized protein n=1 Tax=Dictyobacter halimunensis TaxID=3026934 RepID=A0ABQ6G559_9CHLR|nr:hypothetical protein KDH_75290 [Dictyobacter sp. S3.2.2.5]
MTHICYNFGIISWQSSSILLINDRSDGMDANKCGFATLNKCYVRGMELCCLPLKELNKLLWLILQ